MAQLPNFQSFVTPYGRNTNAQFASQAAKSYADMASSAQQAGATRAAAASAAGAEGQKAAASGYGAYAQGLGSLGGSYADMYGTYGTNLQNLLSNEMAAYGQAETARQVGLANTATAAMSGMGQASAGAMGAWGANQAAWAKAMADAHAADQGAYSQYGGDSQRARAPMLAALAATDLGGYQSGLNYTRDMGKLGLARDLGLGALSTTPQSGDGGVSLSAGGDPLASAYASGVYGGGSGSGTLPPYEAWYSSQQTAPAYQSSAPSARQSMDDMDARVLGGLASNTAATRGNLQDAYYSSQGMPSQMLGQTLSGLTGVLDSSTGSINQGMDQFYAAMRTPADRGREDLTSGLLASRESLDTLSDRMGMGYSGFNSSSRALRPTTQEPKLFPSAVEEEMQRQQAALMRQNFNQQRIDDLRRSGDRSWATLYEIQQLQRQFPSLR